MHEQLKKATLLTTALIMVGCNMGGNGNVAAGSRWNFSAVLRM